MAPSLSVPQLRRQDPRAVEPPLILPQPAEPGQVPPVEALRLDDPPRDALEAVVLDLHRRVRFHRIEQQLANVLAVARLTRRVVRPGARAFAARAQHFLDEALELASPLLATRVFLPSELEGERLLER